MRAEEISLRIDLISHTTHTQTAQEIKGSPWNTSQNSIFSLCTTDAPRPDCYPLEYLTLCIERRLKPEDTARDKTKSLSSIPCRTLSSIYFSSQLNWNWIKTSVKFLVNPMKRGSAYLSLIYVNRFRKRFFFSKTDLIVEYFTRFFLRSKRSNDIYGSFRPTHVIIWRRKYSVISIALWFGGLYESFVTTWGIEKLKVSH